MTFEEWLRSYKKSVADFADFKNGELAFNDDDMRKAFEAGQKNCSCIHTDNSKVIEELQERAIDYEKYLFMLGVKDPKGFFEREKNRKELFRETVEELTVLKEQYRWHYPSKGELPDEGILVLAMCGGWYRLCWYEKGIWKGDALQWSIRAWQYLPEPPQEDSV